MSEKRSPEEIVVQGRHRLARINGSKFHERGLVLWLENKRDTQIELVTISANWSYDDCVAHLWNMFVLFILFAIVIDQRTGHTKVLDNGRVLFLFFELYEAARQTRDPLPKIPRERNYWCHED